MVQFTLPLSGVLAQGCSPRVYRCATIPTRIACNPHFPAPQSGRQAPTTGNQVVCLGKAENEVEYEAAADVRARAAQVTEDGGSGASGFFQGVGQDREPVESFLCIDPLCQRHDG